MRRFVRWLWQHWLISLATLVALGLVGGVGGIAVGLRLEEQNDLCMQCHTQPEYDFWARAQAAMLTAQPVDDLATFHIVPALENKQPNRAPLTCIGCHGGTNLSERVATMFELGALDTLKFVAQDDIRQPATLTHPLPNTFCLQCHTEDVERKGFDNHFHNKLDDPKAPAFACSDCHQAHAEADALQKFILRGKAFPQCNACHQQLGGPLNLQ